MSERFDAILAGSGLVGSGAALLLAKGGRRVLLVDTPGSARPACSRGLVTRGGPAAASLGLPRSRKVAERRFALLSKDTSFSIDVRETPTGSKPDAPFFLDAARSAAALRESARRAGATLWSGAPVSAIRADANGRILGIDAGAKSAVAPVTVLEDPSSAALAAKAGLRWAKGPEATDTDVVEISVEADFALSSSRVNDRMGPGSGAGICLEGVLGFLPKRAMGFGYLVPGTEGISAGVVLHAPSLVRAVTSAAEVARSFETHPAIAPFLRGGTRSSGAIRVLSVRGRRRPTLYGEGFLMAGEATGVLPTSGFVAPSMDLLLGSVPLVVETVNEVLETKDPTGRVTSRYAARLSRAGLFEALDRARGGGARFKWNPRLHSVYPQLFASFFHRMMTEHGQPKEHMRDLLRSAAKEAQVPYTGLALDAVGGIFNL
jgi:electron transfer flavoprotein-quinone oxidoreductase